MSVLLVSFNAPQILSLLAEIRLSDTSNLVWLLTFRFLGIYRLWVKLDSDFSRANRNPSLSVATYLGHRQHHRDTHKTVYTLRGTWRFKSRISSPHFGGSLRIRSDFTVLCLFLGDTALLGVGVRRLFDPKTVCDSFVCESFSPARRSGVAPSAFFRPHSRTVSLRGTTRHVESYISHTPARGCRANVRRLDLLRLDDRRSWPCAGIV